jgi:hypothetical protein
MVLKNQNLKNYVEKGFYMTEGWVQEGLIPVIDLLASQEINQSGGITEVGIHHGRFFMLLNSLTSDQDKSYAIDVFDDQHLNIDNSGKGSLERFSQNLERWDLYKGNNTRIIKGDSTDTNLSLVDIIGKSSMRFFSIDGGHTAEHTVNDLKIANDIIKNDGVVFLDDMPRHNWLGVTEGCVKFIMGSPTLIPFAVGFNKMLFCKLSYHAYYCSLLKNAGLVERPQKFFGYEVMALK